MPDAWMQHFPGLARIEPEARAALVAAAATARLPAGEVVFRSGDDCRNYLLVTDGVVRVHMTSESGREIVLYRVDAGETCVLTTACLLAQEAYSAEAVTETPVAAVAIPGRVFLDQLGRSEALRRFVFSTYAARITSLMMLVEEIAFGRIDVRLARFLSERAAGQAGLAATHQMLAHELGTAREVVSRQLKDFERRGWVRLGRGHVAIIDADALAALAHT